jgi:hypothetical protein
MGFLGLGRPRWKHKDAEIRLHAVSELPASSQGTFAELVRTDVDPRVRAAAAARITEIPTLVSLQQLTDPAVKRIATERLAGVADQWLRTKSLAECRDFLGHLSDQKSLAELSVQAKDPAVRAAAFAKFSALPEPSAALLAVIAIQDAQGDVALSAVARIDKRGALKDISRKAKLDHVRQAALGRIEALEAEAAKPTPEQVRQARRKELPPLLEQALRLAVASDWERAEAAWEPLVAEWAKVCAQLPGDEDAAALQVRFQRARADFIARRQAAILVWMRPNATFSPPVGPLRVRLRQRHRASCTTASWPSWCASRQRARPCRKSTAPLRRRFPRSRRPSSSRSRKKPSG